jgi:hypothetical protein
MDMLDAEAPWISIAATLKRTVQAAQHGAQVLKRNSLIDLKAKDNSGLRRSRHVCPNKGNVRLRNTELYEVQMSKVPSVEHKYHSKHDRLEITIKHYALGKKASREKIIMKLLKGLEQSPAPSIANAKASKKKKSKLPKNPRKESKLQQIGD